MYLPAHMRDYDALIELELLSTEEGGRVSGILSGYRGHHRVKENYCTTGSVEFIDVERLEPGEKALAFVTYITPQAYPNCLWIGKMLKVEEGPRLVGWARIIEIYNEMLLGEDVA